MREQILELKIDTTQVLKDNLDAVYLTEHDAGQILTLICEEIEKVENPYERVGFKYPPDYKLCFERCRLAILALLRSEK